MVALITRIALKVVASITVTATPDLCDETTYSTSVRFRAVVAITVVLPILSRQAVRNDGGRRRRGVGVAMLGGRVLTCGLSLALIAGAV